MTKDYKTMRVPEEAYEQAKEAKNKGETWGEYLRRCSENPPEVREFVDAGDIDLDTVMDQVSMANEAGVEIEGGKILRELEKVQAALNGQPVQLEATEYGKIAEAVEDRLR